MSAPVALTSGWRRDVSLEVHELCPGAESSDCIDHGGCDRVVDGVRCWATRGDMCRVEHHPDLLACACGRIYDAEEVWCEACSTRRERW